MQASGSLVYKGDGSDGREVGRKTVYSLPSMLHMSDGKGEWHRIVIEDPPLWDIDEPNLYTGGTNLL